MRTAPAFTDGHLRPTATDEALGAGTPIKATHLDELRLAVTAVE